MKSQGMRFMSYSATPIVGIRHHCKVCEAVVARLLHVALELGVVAQQVARLLLRAPVLRLHLHPSRTPTLTMHRAQTQQYRSWYPTFSVLSEIAASLQYIL